MGLALLGLLGCASTPEPRPGGRATASGAPSAPAAAPSPSLTSSRVSSPASAQRSAPSPAATSASRSGASDDPLAGGLESADELFGVAPPPPVAIVAPRSLGAADPLVAALEAPPAPAAAPEPAAAQREPPALAARKEAKALLDSTVAAARRALRARDPVAAALALESARPAAKLVGPSASELVASLAMQVATLAGGTDRAAVATAWLLSCGPDRMERCRTAALAALTRLSRGPPRSPSLAARVAATTAADRCLKQVEAAPKLVPACAAAALAHYRRERDLLQLARVQLGRGRSLSRGKTTAAAAIAELEAAQASCLEPRCVAVRRRALTELAKLHAAAGADQEAASAAIREQALAAEQAPDPAHARTRLVERSCKRLDLSAGRGSCRALEKRLTGRWIFRDFSSRAAGGTLPAALVDEVGREYEPLLSECLRAQGERLTPPAEERYEVRWAVARDGRVTQVHLDRRAQDDGPLASCLRAQFELWRYPRTTGELQHVEQAFTVRSRGR